MIYQNNTCWIVMSRVKAVKGVGKIQQVQSLQQVEQFQNQITNLLDLLRNANKFLRRQSFHLNTQEANLLTQTKKHSSQHFVKVQLMLVLRLPAILFTSTAVVYCQQQFVLRVSLTTLCLPQATGSNKVLNTQ